MLSFFTLFGAGAGADAAWAETQAHQHTPIILRVRILGCQPNTIAPGFDVTYARVRYGRADAPAVAFLPLGTPGADRIRTGQVVGLRFRAYQIAEVVR